MSFEANQYNYATPISSVSDFGSTHSDVHDIKYFTLADNVLDGSYFPISGDVGLWGSTVSNVDGALPEPFVVSVESAISINAFLIIGSTYAYPVDFTITFFNGDSVVYERSVVGNTLRQYLEHFTSTIEATRYDISISRISHGGTVARVFNTYTPDYVKRTDTVPLHCADTGVASEQISKGSRDSLLVAVIDAPSHVMNIIDKTHDVLAINNVPSGNVINVHSIMREPSRRIYGKVYITYTDPMLASSVITSSSGAANCSNVNHVSNGVDEARNNTFMLYDNDLTGVYTPIGGDDEVGWISSQLSGKDGFFSEPYPYIEHVFSERPIIDFMVSFDAARSGVIKDFTIEFTHSNGDVTTKSFVDNTESRVTINETIARVTGIRITVSRVAKEGIPAVILEAPVISTKLYVGYKDTSDIVSIDLLEELSYTDDVEALGGISANEITVTLDNSKRDFFFNNPKSLVAGSLKRNRKIVPWLGVELTPGSIEWYTLGTFWSYNWDVPVQGLTASVTGFDTIGLLDTTSFTNHTTLFDRSIGELIEYVLNDAKQLLDFIAYRIDERLYDIRIPYAWFDAGSHTAALRKVSGCYPVHIYCDRQGTIVAALQQLSHDYHYDTWSGSTNITGTKYKSLYTTLPNIVNVTVYNPVVTMEDSLTTYNVPFDVEQNPTRILNFTKPYVSDISISVDCDDTVQYTYVAYSWGIEFSFTGTGYVRQITCAGYAVDISSSSLITMRDNDSVLLNGAITRDIASDFIQSNDHASMLISRINELSKNDMYDAEVDYRGNIAISINDPIVLSDSITPTKEYTIKRHELFWNGALSGSAYLNT